MLSLVKTILSVIYHSSYDLIIIYAGEDDQYYAYCTPEAYNALKRWMDYREMSGEKITGKSWIMRDLWATLDPRISGSINIHAKIRRKRQLIQISRMCEGETEFKKLIA